MNMAMLEHKRERERERAMQYIKDRIENFDDCFLCRKERCKHVTSWFNVFFDSYNSSMAS
jgi:hypothetical protein